MEETNFFDFINPILESHRFNWFPLLGFGPHGFRRPDATQLLWEKIWESEDPMGLEGWRKAPRQPSDCLERWLTEMGPYGRGDSDGDYLWFEEERIDGVRFHVLISDFRGDEDKWKERWNKISGGWAITRTIDPERGVAGLLGHFVMRAGFRMAVDCDPDSGRYTQEDFRQWRPK